MTVKDNELIEALLCVADLCLNNPESDELAGAAITIVCDSWGNTWYPKSMWEMVYQEMECEYPIDGVNDMWYAEYTGNYTTKGIAALRAARRIEETRGILR